MKVWQVAVSFITSLVIIAIAIAIGISVNACNKQERVQTENWGQYVGTLNTIWLDDGRNMQLVEDFVYVDKNNKVWIAEKGTVVDGASIPRPFWTVIGGPFEGPYRKASVIHDAYYVNVRENSDVVHEMFYNAMRCAGVSETKAKLMYYAVYHFGGSWKVINIEQEKEVVDVNGKVSIIKIMVPKMIANLPPKEVTLTPEQITQIEKSIADNNYSLDDIKNMK